MVDYTIHIPDEQYARVKQAAGRDQRSIHKQILWLIDQGLGSEEQAMTTHTHTYAGQKLRHSHDGGNHPHGYFQHPEDTPQQQPYQGELYNGVPLAAMLPGNAEED